MTISNRDGDCSFVPLVSPQLRSVTTFPMRIPVMWATDSGDVGQSRSEATLVVF
jgi:hypothetical protein